MFNRKRDETVHHVAPRELAQRVERPPLMAPAMAGQQNGLVEISNTASRFSQSAINSGSVIGSDLVIEGEAITIRCKGSLRVDGNIRADLNCRQVEVGPQAIINGTIAAHEVNVDGRVQGAIMARTLMLRASAQVEGDIHSEYVSVELGASFDGRARRVTDPQEITPQLESVTAMPVEVSGVNGSDHVVAAGESAGFATLQQP